MTMNAAAHSPEPNAPGLSTYEQIRAKNIERNNARLRALGLISKLEERLSNDLAWRRTAEARADDASTGLSDEGSEYEDNDEDDDEAWLDPRRPHGATAITKRGGGGRKRGAGDEPPAEGSRKSMRLQGIAAGGSEIAPRPTSKEDIEKEREERVIECREVRLRAARAMAEEGAERAARENPTATYEHCLMRVRTMSEKGLANRIKAIERAAGKHCVVKMGIFKSCLQDEGNWTLAELASAALERLKGIQAPV